MKISTFHLMPHRELPDDFEQRYQSVWVTHRGTSWQRPHALASITTGHSTS